MTSNVSKLLKGGKKNKEFLAEIYAADGDKPPGLFADSLAEHIFCSVYYGWLVAKYGNRWRNNI